MQKIQGMKNYQEIKLGILGGGQLGRMMVQSAIDYNLQLKIIDPDENAPCKNLVEEFVVGKLTDFDTVVEFGKDCDLITIEIENVNTAALKELQKMGKKVFPQPEVIELIQDKRTQKQFYQDNDIPTSEFVLTENQSDLNNHEDFLPAVHKLGKEGYDGRGVQRIMDSGDIEKGFDKPGLLEKFVDFDREISVIVARNEDGQMKSFPVVELVFHPEANLVEYLFAPSTVSEEIANDAQAIAERVISKLDMVGLLAVEMFVTKDGQVLVNESAPRTHNSGHQTIEANVTSQFEQHLRAILNMPLGATRSYFPAAMVNLLGAEGYTGPARYEGMDEILAMEGVHVHLYGKMLTKPFRKMGHVTITDTDLEKLREKAQIVKEKLKVIS